MTMKKSPKIQGQKHLCNLVLAGIMLCLPSFGCHGKAENIANDSDSIDMPLTSRGIELLNEVAHARTIGQSIFEYGNAAQALQKEMLLFVDTCQERGPRFINRRLANVMSLDIMNSVMDDSAQFHYYLDSILMPYKQVDSHWFIREEDSVTIFSCEAYFAEGEDVHIFEMDLAFFEEGVSWALIEYPYDAVHSPSLMFASDENLMQPDEIFGQEDDGIIILQPDEKKSPYDGRSNGHDITDHAGAFRNVPYLYE